MKTRTKVSFSNKETPREVAHRALARSIAAESIVLLENDGTLPLAPCKIALFGAGAGLTIKGGTGSGEVNERHAVTICEGLEAAGFTITTHAWINDYIAQVKTEKDAFGKSFLKKALFGNADDRINIMADSYHYPAGRAITDAELKNSDTDICIYVIARQAGECSDRSLQNHEYHLEEAEIQHLNTIAKAYKKVIVAINVGSAIDMQWLGEVSGINAVVYFCQQGMEGGNAFADIITGKANPSGCLTNSWAKQYEDLPFAMDYSYLNGNTTDENYKEGIYVGYRYFDSFGIAPRYPFGYGKSYTEFSIACSNVEVTRTTVAVSAAVANTGKAAGKKVVQLYASCPSGTLPREYQCLAAFAKTKSLKPGETQTVTLQFDMTDLAAYDEESAAYVLEKGDYVLRLGANAADTAVCGKLYLDGTVQTEICTNVCKATQKVDEIAAPVIHHSADGQPIATVHAADIQPIQHSYNVVKESFSARAESIVNSLTQEEKLKLLMGSGVMGVKPYFNAPGAAATTTSALVGKGVCDIALCDGPAGLCLQRTSVVTKSGDMKPVDAMMDFMNYMPKFVKMFMFGNPEKDTPVYQYATAFPVGTAMAQTWNTEIVEQFGSAVGTEMEEYGATLWLAPGMNIHRNPLCGRNYEYFSEDPLVSGKMAAAITRGVQSHEGCYVTLKHYAANNQETNRNKSSSNMGERTLREIYLKGFKIAVKESAPKGVMTSYNRLNGTYTPNSYDLCTKLLRNEWGFSGLVMTDWFSTGKGLGGNGTAIKAGNDLIMPGGKEYMKMLQQDIADGKVTDAEIRLSCLRILEIVLSSQIQKEMDAKQ